MPGVPQVTKQNHSYTAASPVIGGRFCQGNGDRIEHASAASTKVLGVALTDAFAPEAFTGTPAVVAGRSVLDASALPHKVALAYSGTEVPVEYAADAAFGDALVTAANGKATPAGAGADPRTIVARCTQPGGVTVSTRSTGLARIL